PVTQMTVRACEGCIRRSWLLARLGGHLENVRGRIELALGLADEDLIAAVAGRGRGPIEREWSAVDAGAVSGQAIAQRLDAICRWSFPARNRIIAALAALTVVVEATERSGALLTAAHARALGQRVAAVPGRVTSPLAAGPNALLARGAALVRGPQDVLDLLF